MKLRGLARAGANLMNKALSWAPALSTAAGRAGAAGGDPDRHRKPGRRIDRI